jgi:hypothetical protein
MQWENNRSSWVRTQGCVRTQGGFPCVQYFESARQVPGRGEGNGEDDQMYA